MKVKYNDGALIKKELSQEINQISLLIVNKNDEFLMTFEDGRYVLPSFVIPQNSTFEETLDNISVHFFGKKGMINSKPFVSIEDWQYRYPFHNTFHINRLVNTEAILVQSSKEMNTSNCFYMKLFELIRLFSQNNDQDYYHYDDRTTKTIVGKYLEDNYQMFFDTNNYLRYLKNYYNYESDNNRKQAKVRSFYVDNFAGRSFAEEICTGTKYLISHMLDYLQIIDDSYAKLPLVSISGLNNGNKDWYADLLGIYEETDEAKIVSLYLLKNLLGFDFKIYLFNDHEEIKNDNGEVIGEYNGFPYFLIKGDMNKLLDVGIKEENNLSLTRSIK